MRIAITRRRVVLLGIIMALSVSGYPAYCYFRGRPAAVEAERLLEGTEDARVTWFQLYAGGVTTPPRPPAKELQGYEILLEKTVTGAEVVGDFRSIVTSPWTYDDSFFMCFNPGMALRFEANGRKLDFVICLECARIRAWENQEEQSGDWFLSRRGVSRLYAIYAAHAVSTPN